MGSLQASEIASITRAGGLQLGIALNWHLSSNHYPPVPPAFADTCLAAIEAGQSEDWDTDIKLPRGCRTHSKLIGIADDQHADCDVQEDAITWSDDRDHATAGALIESFHLDSFL